MTNQSTVPVSVAIPAFKSDVSLRETLRRICACDPMPREILIHEDGGWHVPPDAWEDLPIPVRIFSSKENIGPGGGRNRLFHEAECEIIASFDDDSWPMDREYFAQAVAVMEVFPNVAVMSPAVYLREKPVLPPMKEASIARSFEGSASVNRRSHYLQLPGYVPVPEAYGVEEADLSLQIHAAGFQMLSCPWMRAWHERPHADHKHTVLPWIRNEVLLVYLRFPYIAQPWGWLRALKHVWRHRQQIPLRVLLREFAHGIPHAFNFHQHKHRYSLGQVWDHHRCKTPRFCLADDEAGKLCVSPAPPSRRVLYIQYTNPGSYPPLEHSAQMFAREGWEVEFCGLNASGAVSLEFAPHPRIKVRRMKYQAPGFMQKLHYVRFMCWCLWRVWRWHPEWLYASDALSTPAVELIRRYCECRIVYHEHDSPMPSTVFEYVQRSRLKLGRSADIVILPNQQRLEAFTHATGALGAGFCVWNCPCLGEVPAAVSARSLNGPLKVLYHGSIVPDRFGFEVLEALAACERDVRVLLIGYLPAGFQAYADQLTERARSLGVADRFEYLGAVPQRAELMRLGSGCHAGLCLLRIHENDINMQHMAGASNKPFDYLSQGIALIVPSDPEWERLYVETGCAKTCPINDPGKLAEVFRWMADHRAEVAEMGGRGHQLVLDQWNYEKQFAPVLALMKQTTDARPRP